MALLSDYTAGTVTVAAGGTAVTGVGTAFLSAGFQEGDEFFAVGWHGIIQSVQSNTALTLYPTGIRGAALAGAAYRLRYQGDNSRVTAQARQLITLLGGSGNLEALAGLQGAADRLAYFNGAGTMTVSALTPAARAILALDGSAGVKIPVVTGPGAAALRELVGGVSQSGGVPNGAIMERGENANGQYIRFADGTQICTHSLTGSSSAGVSVTWTYPVSFATVTGLSLSVTPFHGSTTYVRSAQVSGRTASSMDFYAWGVPVSGGAALGSGVTHQLIAIGRWA